jgi:plastocyanin
VSLVLACGTGARAWSDEAATGRVLGAVKYDADPKRPWRYARYYVADQRQAFLAEAVVALRGNGLDQWPVQCEPKTHEMDQVNFQFVPELLAIRRQDSVRFHNGDRETHNVRASGTWESFNVNTPVEGHYTHRFAKAGNIRSPVRVGCAFHGAMRAWIYVFDHPFYSVTDKTGQFNFSHVPAGRYQLEVHHPAGQLRWRKQIEVKANDKLDLQIQLTPDNKV